MKYEIRQLNLDSEDDSTVLNCSYYITEEDRVRSFSLEVDETLIMEDVNALLDNIDSDLIVTGFIHKYDPLFMKENFVSQMEQSQINYDNGKLFFRDDVEIDEATSAVIYKQIMKNKTIDKITVENFRKKVNENISPFVREQLLTWIQYMGLVEGETLTIAPDGDLIGYKGLTKSPNGKMVSIHSGPGIVNGEKFQNARLENEPGNIVEIDRDIVDDDPATGCSSGLHIGTFSYASRFADTDVVLCKFDPADVVSVPVDCNAQKVRVCKYEVIDKVNKPIKLGFLNQNEDIRGLISEDWKIF